MQDASNGRHRCKPAVRTLMLVAAAGVFALVAIGLYATPFRTATAPV
jgi:cell division protein FtsN